MQKLDSRYCPFEGYTTQSKIGHGSYGSVYLIQREVGASTFSSAMKVIHISSPISSELEISVEQEIVLLHNLGGNPHIVRYEDHRIEKSSYAGTDIYIRMEYLTPLDTWLNRQTDICYRNIAEIGAAICDALCECKKHDIVHRDIKADNVFVNDSGKFKLGDFGIAKVLDITNSETKATDRHLGGLNYTAPEIYHGSKYDARADLYSVGMLMYRLLNERKIPFLSENTSEEQALKMRLNGESFPKPKYCEPGLWRVIQKACAFSLQERYQDAEEMKKALEEVLQTDGMKEKIYLSRQNATTTSNQEATLLRANSGSSTSSDRRIPPEPPKEDPEPAPSEDRKLRQLINKLRRLVNSMSKRKQRIILAAALALFIAIVGVGIALILSSGDDLIDDPIEKIVKYYDGSAFQLKGMVIYKCDRLDFRMQNLQSMIEKDKAKSCNEVIVRNAGISAQNDKWVLSLITGPGTQPQETVEITVKLTLPDGTSKKMIYNLRDMDEENWQSSIDLDDLLDAAWTNERWVTGKCALEIYTDGAFVKDKIFELATQTQEVEQAGK